MSRLSQMINFVNTDPIPSQQKRSEQYMSISNFEELKQGRRERKKAERSEQ